MITQIREELQSLADKCIVQPRPGENGWSADLWDLGVQNVDSLVDVYRALLLPADLQELVQPLIEDGLDLQALFFKPEASTAEIVRSDMTELAAAASMIAVEHVFVDHIHCPNVPKGSQRQSTSGIDLLGVTVDQDNHGADVSERDVLFIGSVKHTIHDPKDLRRKLVKSVTTELTTSYLAQQMRVLLGQLELVGIRAPRFMRIIAPNRFPDTAHVRILAVAVVDTIQSEQMVAELTQFPQKPQGIYHLRTLSISQLANLQTRVMI